MRRPPADTDRPDRAEAAEAIARQRGSDRLPVLVRMMLHSPSVAVGWNELASAIRYGTTLDDRLRELIICFIARATDSSYEWEVHEPIARAAGVSEATLLDLPEVSEDADLTDRERVALTLVGRVLEGTVDDVTFDTAARHFDEEALLEVIVAASFYHALSRFLQAFAITTEQTDR